MIIFRVKIVFLLLFHGFCSVNCGILGSAKQNTNSRDDKSTFQGHVTVHPEGSSNTMDNKISIRKLNHSVIPLRSIHDSKFPTPIVHLIPHNIPQKSEEQTLKQLTSNHEFPQLRKKMHHHITMEDLRQKRKELREKWQARHNLLSQESPHKLHSKNQDSMKVQSKHFEFPHIPKNIDLKSHSAEELLKRNMTVENTHPKTISSLYEQITPRTRRILEHKDEKEPSDSSKTKYPISAKTSFGTTSLRRNSKYNKNEKQVVSENNIVNEGTSVSNQDVKLSTETAFNPNYVNYPFMPDPMIAPMYYWPNSASTTSSTTTSSEPLINNTNKRYSTESDFHPNYVNYPFMPDPMIAPMYYWPIGASTPSSSTSVNPEKTMSDSSARSENENMEKFSSITISPTTSSSNSESLSEQKVPDEGIKVEEQISRSSNMRQGDIRPFGYGPSVENVVSPIFVEIGLLATSTSSFNISKFKQRSLAEKTTTTSETTIDVGSVKIDPPIFEEKVDTMNTDTASSYKNSTFHEQILYQKPVSAYGKSAEQVGSIHPNTTIENQHVTVKIDTRPYHENLTDEEKILVQNPLEDLEKSAERVIANENTTEKIDHSVTGIKLKHGKKTYFDSGKSGEKSDSGEEYVKHESDLHPTVRHGKRSSEHTTSSPGGSAMKIAEETHVHQDWRENLRRAIKDRLRKINSDSEEQ